MGNCGDRGPATGPRSRNQFSSVFFYVNICVILVFTWSFYLLAVGASNSAVLSHRHRLHHGANHARTRSRRDGNTPSPYAMQSDSYTRGTDYKTIDDRGGQQNLHKPDFYDCANYRPETAEGQPEGTPVIQVEARDDDPEDNGGTVTYSIVSDDDSLDAFNVDPHSGWLTTKKSFDRDEPKREKEVYVTVRATDNGRPQLDAVCTLKVKITDINDNSPMFDKYVYEEKVPQDYSVGQVVMRISATDIDEGNNGTIIYSLQPDGSSPRDIDFFEVVPLNGEVKLKKPIDDFRLFRLRAVAYDRGTPEPRNSVTALTIEVIEPHKKPPRFIPNYESVKYLKEGFSRSGNRSAAIFEIEASANTDEDGVLFFSLYKGQTEATNKDNTFTLEPDPVNKNKALIKLDKDLDYETVNEYILTVRASNKYNLAAETQITVKVEDENDNKPNFQEGLVGTVLENEPSGTSVMRVRAYDLDGTSPNNKVTLSLSEEDSRNFHIDAETGEITTRKEFDREIQDVYQLTVIARDGAPSAISNNGLPNERPTVLKIEIADKNDNEPTFAKERYEAEINEDADLNSKVIEVKAIDKDTASVLTYNITQGNIGDAFAIGYANTGIIVIKNNLDYEEIRRYELTIRASDSLHDTYTKVIVNVVNINDNPPVFEAMETNITIQEETVPTDCIFRVKAYDPDIGDRTQAQNIAFFIESGKDHFAVDKYEGCVKVIKPLDRDPPNGYSWYPVRVGARDEGGSQPTSLIHYQDLSVTLTDINDNAPFLNCSNPVKWEENIAPGRIVELTAQDYDADDNGAPFSFSIGANAEAEIRSSFQIQGSMLNAVKENFDREQRKEYAIPIVIVDSGTPRKTGTSTLTVVIGDQNDNDMEDGESKIFVYKFKQNETHPIGRVYVKDPDDWDLPDKVFSWETGNTPAHFTLDRSSGDIGMKPSITEGQYTLRFMVQDNRRNNQARAIVNVTVKQIPEEAVIQSGSIRFMGITKEQFIKPDATGKSKRDRLRTEIAKLFKLKEKNVDIFTVINSPHVHDLSIIDVRYSAHGSPYYKQERLDGIVGERRGMLERALELNIMMVRVDECISEKKHCESSCRNKLMTSSIPYNIYTNTSSFGGVNAYVHPVCSCELPSEKESVCGPNPCLNNGICRSVVGVKQFECECDVGFEGPRCEKTSVAFEGNGYAWYRPLPVCNDSSLEMQINVPRESSDSLILYNGPVYQSPMNITDFISIELKSGKPLLLLDYGTGVSQIHLTQSPVLSDGQTHKISVWWSSNKISMQVDECMQKSETCFNTTSPRGTNSYLNVNGPLQLGGVSFRPKEFRSSMKWDFIPSDGKLVGCVSNLTFNGEYYDLGDPSFFMGNVSSCDSPRHLQSASLGVGIHFIIILIICILMLLILVIAIVFYRRRQSYEEVKGDPHDDVRENIINYSDEGGGEGDQTGYDLSVLMKPTTTNGPYMGEKIPMNDLPLQQGQMPGSDIPDIQSFLQGNKNKVDNDPEGLPYDDVRNYAYEGDGNSMGSLSSLASGTDDGDLNFDYLPTFGPRFKKLADMYGGQSSDDDSYTGPPPEAWC